MIESLAGIAFLLGLAAWLVRFAAEIAQHLAWRRRMRRRSACYRVEHRLVQEKVRRRARLTAGVVLAGAGLAILAAGAALSMLLDSGGNEVYTIPSYVLAAVGLGLASAGMWVYGVRFYD